MPGLSRCMDCSENYCISCARLHLNMELSRGHRLVDRSDLLNPTAEPIRVSKAYCEKHETEELAVYCEDCAKTVCLRCSKLVHVRHKCTDIEDIAREKREELRNVLDEKLIDCLIELKRNVNSVKQSNQNSKDSFQNDRQWIISKAEELRTKIDETVKSQFAELDQVEMEKSAILEKKSQNFDQKVQALQLVIQNAGCFLDFAGDSEILMKFPTLKTLLLQTKKENQSACGWVSEEIALQRSVQPTVKSDIAECFGTLQVEHRLAKHYQFQPYRRFKIKGLPRINSICPIAWVAHFKTVQLCGKDGSKSVTINPGGQVHDVAKDRFGNVYVACNTAIRKITTTAKVRGCFGLPCQNPKGLAVTNEDEFLVCFPQSAACMKFSKEGELLLKINPCDDGTNFKPRKVGVTSGGDICITTEGDDSSGYILDKNGKLKSEYREPDAVPYGLCCSEDHLYVTDCMANTVHVMSDRGDLLQSLFKPQRAVDSPTAISLDPVGDLWIGDSEGNVKIFRNA